MTTRNLNGSFWVAAVLFVGSGFSSLAFQTVFNKYFSFIFGVSAYSAATVLAAFMTGLAVGNWWLGRLSSHWFKRHLLWYGALEALIGLYALGFLDVAGFVDNFYTPLARDHQFTLRGLTVLRFLSAFVLVGLPSSLMGGTLPVLVEGLRRRGLTTSVNVLYVLNVVGAALGVLISSYVLLPSGSLPGVLKVVFAINFSILAVSALLQWFSPVVVANVGNTPAVPVQRADVAMPLLILSALSGLITFSNEVAWYHLLGLVVGTSVYAYAVMLFTTLLGMSVGGALAQRLQRQGLSATTLLVGSQLGLALATVACIPFWDRIPDLFSRLELVATTFAARELIRFVASCLLILPAAIFAGITFPVLLSEVERTSNQVGASVGRLTAVNTLGTVAGSLVTGFVLLGILGGRGMLFLSALLSIATIAVVPGVPRARLVRTLAVATACWVAALALMPDWNVKRLLSGANIYFGKAHDDFDELVWQHEDYVGGVTSVIRTGNTHTLLTNGKFQGNDGAEVRDQRRFALIPNLFVAKPRRALNIGLGTATTLGVIGRFPYTEIDAVELSPDIVTAAKTWFGSVNDKVLERPEVKVHLEDGRNFLALNPKGRTYDLISIELTSIWFAGAGNLYSDEFYSLAKENLSEDGVVQQWLQLHHVSHQDLAVIIGTLRKHFRYVELWLPSHQGILVASQQPLRLNEARLNDVKKAFPPTDFFANDARTVLGERLLSSEQVDEFLAEANREVTLPLSTDQNLYLEFSTPRGNVLGWNFDDNLAILSKHSRPNWASMLGPLEASDPSLVVYGTIGQANFSAPRSVRWHQTIDDALSRMPDAQYRGELKGRLLEALAQKKTPVSAPPRGL